MILTYLHGGDLSLFQLLLALALFGLIACAVAVVVIAVFVYALKGLTGKADKGDKLR